MGGHGALIMALKNPGKYTSVSAFAPIVNPCSIPWGIKAFSTYLGEDKNAWLEWDSCALMYASNAQDAIDPLCLLCHQWRSALDRTEYYPAETTMPTALHSCLCCHRWRD